MLITPLFKKEKESLGSRLAALSDKQAERIVQEFLEMYFGPQSEFKRKLPDSERFLINSVLAFSKAQGDLFTQEMPQTEKRPTAVSQPFVPQPDYPAKIARDGIVALTTVVLASSGIGWSVLGVAAGMAAGQGFGVVKKKMFPTKSPVQFRKDPRSRFREICRKWQTTL